MKKSLLVRFKALLAIAADKLTDSEKSELGILTAKAAAAKIDTKSLDTAIENATEEDGEEDGEMSEDEVKEVVSKAVKEAMASQKSVSSDDIAEKVTLELAKKSVSEDKMRSIVEDVLKTHTKSASKMEFPMDGGGSVEFPVESRAGNLSIAQKQLLNLCLQKVSEDSLRDHGTKRPSGINDGINENLLRRSKAANEVVLGKIRRGEKGLTTGGSGSGAELVYTDLSTDLQQRLYLASDLAQVMLSREINMPTDPFKLPIKTVRTAFSAGSESPTPSTLAAYLHHGNPTLDQITLDAKKMIGIASYSYEANEDSVLAILPMLQQDLGDGAAMAYESALINGDADGTHQDTGPSYGATSVETLFNGIRKAGIATGVLDWSTGGVSKSNFMAARAAMGKYGVNPADLAIIVSPYGYVQLQAMEEAFRYDARGSANLAAVNSGTIASFNGIRVIVSEVVPSGVIASGINDGIGTYESLLITNLTQWLVGTRRGFTVEVSSDPIVQTNYVVASFRRAFTQKETASASIPHTVLATKWG